MHVSALFSNCAGPPLPPQDVQVLCGQAPGVLQVRWKPPILSPTGTSNGANVIGYVVCTKGQKVNEQMSLLQPYFISLLIQWFRSHCGIKMVIIHS